MSSKRTGGQENCSDGFQNDVDDDLVNLLSQLQLPRMNPDEPPTIRILAVADIDLASAAALAEYALHENELGGGNVDLCIACGPFVRDEDVRTRYLQGKSKSRRKERASHERTREETAALEGLMSGALSQLESIVCRVVFCPHPTDPSTTLFKPDHLRLTPNSCNVHQRWLQLAPGIGCSGFGGITDDQGLLTGPDAVRVQHGYVSHSHCCILHYLLCVARDLNWKKDVRNPLVVASSLVPTLTTLVFLCFVLSSHVADPNMRAC